jgi:hypothetical protein
MPITNDHNRDLIRQNLDLLNQAVVLLERLPEAAYMKESVGGQRVGPQMRHVLEFYDCFLAGLAGFHVDYSARKRDSRIAESPLAAAEHARQLVETLAGDSDAGADCVVWVRAESDDAFVMSTMARELQTLISHTTHHYALISLLLQWQGIAVEREFGVSQSTLRYWERVVAA